MGPRCLGTAVLDWMVALRLSLLLRHFQMGQADRPRLTSRRLQATAPVAYVHIRGGHFAQRRLLLWLLVEEEMFGLLPVEPIRLRQSRQLLEECLAGRNLHVVTIGWAQLAVI